MATSGLPCRVGAGWPRRCCWWLWRSRWPTDSGLRLTREIVVAAVPAALQLIAVGGLPGAMTGLILAEFDPLTAVRYQIVVMYMLLAATALAALTAARLAERTLFDDAHRLVPLPPLADHE